MSLLHSGSTAVSGEVLAEGVDFDGTYDYLSRSTDLVGNVDSKTFTFSCWVYYDGDNNFKLLRQVKADLAQYPFQVEIQGTGVLTIYGVLNTTLVLRLTSTMGVIPKNTYTHILLSIDLNNVANRSLYINDKSIIPTWNTYTNSTIGFSGANLHTIASDYNATLKLKGRLSHLFLDYTYRDLSIEANRRLFITADGKPTPTATLKALNPILYLPMKDAATAHINYGTGGNFTPNGTFATSNRGANQDNCVASKFDGVDDLLVSGAILGSKTFTISCNLSTSHLASYPFVLYNSGNSYTFYITSYPLGLIAIVGKNSVGAIILNAQTTVGSPAVLNGRITQNLSIAIDMTDQNKLRVYRDGLNVPMSITVFTNDILACDKMTIGNTTTYTAKQPTIVGELYFDTKYIDLAANNPFWDSVENKPVPVRKVIANTGVTPLIAMPIRADIPGKNYGTGGDFTLYG